MQARARTTRTRALSLLVVTAALLCLGAPVRGQEGHPLAGSWHGDWGLGGTARNDLTLIMDWDGQRVSGLVNPVTDRAELIDARLDSSNWTVRFAVDLEDDAGDTMRCVADGRLDKLGSDRRTLAGRWTCGTRVGDFELTRDRDY